MRVLLKYKKIKNLIFDIKPDILHSMYATSYGLLGSLSGFHPLIVTPLGSDVLISPNKSIIYKILLRYTFKKADLITYMALHMKLSMLKLGVKENKLENIFFGINTNVFNRVNRKVLPTEFVITSTRNFEPVYNIPHFLHAIALVRNKIPTLKVILLGDGSLKAELLKLADELMLNDIVSFKGKVSQKEVAEILNQSHIFCSVSLSDGNSLSLIEALACGTYPVVSDIPANREWITGDVNGSFVTTSNIEGLADTFNRVYHNYDDIILLANAENDKIISEKGTWKTNITKMEEIYNRFYFKNS